jgi:hypothetical protein
VLTASITSSFDRNLLSAKIFFSFVKILKIRGSARSWNLNSVICGQLHWNEHLHCGGGITFFSWQFLGVFPNCCFQLLQKCFVVEDNQLAKSLWGPKKPMPSLYQLIARFLLLWSRFTWSNHLFRLIFVVNPGLIHRSQIVS